MGNDFGGLRSCDGNRVGSREAGIWTVKVPKNVHVGERQMDE